MSKARELADLGSVTTRLDEVGNTDGALSNRNLIINGAMQVAQRGTSFTASTNAYTVDRFRQSQTSAFLAWQKDGDAPSGFSSSLKATVSSTSTPAAADLSRIIYTVEAQDLQHLNYGSSSAQTLTLSFWVKSNVTGSYSIFVYSQDADRAYVVNYSISGASTWEYKTVAIQGDTLGGISNDNGQGLAMEFNLISGSGWATGGSLDTWASAATTVRAKGQTANIGSNVSNYWQITGVQLEVGDTATPFEHRSYGDELARCQRYFQLYPEETTVTGSCYNNDPDWYFPFVFPEMRAAPTVTFSDVPLLFCNDVNSDTTSVTSSSNNDNRKSVRLQAQNAAVGSAGQAGWFQLNAANSYFTLDAEL